MISKKKTKTELGAALIADRFNANKTIKPKIQRASVTEFTNISMLSEKLSMENKKIYNTKFATQSEGVEDKYYDLINSLEYNLSIPPRVPLSSVEKGEYKAVEDFVFNRWKFFHDDKLFERNIEIWRQFWLTCERADTIAQIIDSRNPEFFYNEDIIKMYPTKKHIILSNKCDLVQDKMQHKDAGNVYFYSAKTHLFSFKMTGTLGLIGYPNVGKSSTINMILNQKRVKVSSTPGKTKYIQSIETVDFTLLDCPGLVFPRHSKIDLVLMGILNVEQIPELNNYENYIINHVPKQAVKNFYKLKNTDPDLINGMCIEKGWIRSNCLKNIVKDYSLGNIPYN